MAISICKNYRAITVSLIVISIIYVYRNNISKAELPKKGHNWQNARKFSASETCDNATNLRWTRDSSEGFEVCASGRFRFNEDSIVYIFGISENFALLDTFIASNGCKIRVCDHSGSLTSIDVPNRPAIPVIRQGLSGTNNENRRFMTLGDLRDKWDESMKTIDLVFIHPKYANLDVMRTIFANDGFFRVKQVVVTLQNDHQAKKLRDEIYSEMTMSKFTKLYENRSTRCFVKGEGCRTLTFINTRYFNSDTGFAPEEMTQTSTPDLSTLGNQELEDQFTRFVKRRHVDCKKYKRVGKSDDGGWNVCLDGPFEPKPPCLVYSFGIRNEWSFDDGMANIYGCHVRSFDPSMSAGTHNRSSHIWFYAEGIAGFNGYDAERKWNMKTLGGFINAIGDTGKTIDYLKIDVDYSEWDSFPAMVKEGVLKHVKQFSFEFHTQEMFKHRRRMNKYDSTADHLRQYWTVLKSIEDEGFRKWSVHSNGWGMYDSKLTGKRRTCCYEVFYINSNYIV